MCKLENAKLPDYSIPDTFWTDSISGLDKLTGMKSGDICVIPYFGGGLTYMYDGTKWVKIMYNELGDIICLKHVNVVTVVE